MIAELLTALCMTILLYAAILIIFSFVGDFVVSAINAKIKAWRKADNDRNP
jgi:hypothetical protein